MKADEKPEQSKPASGEAPAPAKPVAESSGPAPEPEKVEASQLTPEEQLAQFEKALKEEDWGHQPC